MTSNTMQSKTYLPLILAFLVALCPAQLRAGDKKAVAAGVHVGYVIKDDGSLWAFGTNFSGHLGDGTRVLRDKPVKILDGIKQVATSGDHTLALGADGAVYAWGYNYNGSLGDGTCADRAAPVKVMEGIAQVASGQWYSLAVGTDGTLYGWGDNTHGALGLPDLGVYPRPVPIMKGVRQVAASTIGHTLILLRDGTLLGCGSDKYGECSAGMGERRDFQSTPVRIMSGVRQVSAGELYSAAVLDDGTLLTWGQGNDGRLGNGSQVDCEKPKRVLTDVKEVSAGPEHALAVRNDGTLWGWGRNIDGQLGDGTTTWRVSPVKVASYVRTASAGNSFSMWITTSGDLVLVGNIGMN